MKERDQMLPKGPGDLPNLLVLGCFYKQSLCDMLSTNNNFVY